MSEKAEKYLKFKCPECSDTRLQEICSGVVQSATCDFITDTGIIDYGETSYDGGELSHYQCLKCGYVIRDGNDCNIDSEEELVAWLKEHCPQDYK